MRLFVQGTRHWRQAGMVLALSVCGLSFAQAAQAGPREEAMAVIGKWKAAFAASDVDAIVALYAPDALFFGTGSHSLVKDPAGVRAYFESGLLSRRPRGATLDNPEVMVVSDTVVIVTGLNDTSGVQDGKTVVSPGRVTFVVANRGHGWRIVHFHRSAMPK